MCVSGGGGVETAKDWKIGDFLLVINLVRYGEKIMKFQLLYNAIVCNNAIVWVLVLFVVLFFMNIL